MIIDIKDDRSERVKYDYPDYPIYIRRGLLSTFPNYAADSHWHDDIELIAVISGQMLYNVNGRIITLNEGEGIIINAKQFHYGFSENKTECDFICILFHPMLLCATNKFEKEYLLPILNSDMSYLHLSPNVEWQSNILKYIQNICERNNIKSAPLHIQGLLYMLWNEVVSHTELAKTSVSNTDHRLTILKNMIAYIHENYNQKITLENIAAAGRISKRTSQNLFLEYQNKTPIEFLTDYRLRKGIELMKTTDMTILEISLAVGFSSASYFAETFKIVFGKTPTQYRKSI